MSRIEDVLYADSLSQDPSLVAVKRKPPPPDSGSPPPPGGGESSPPEETATGSPSSMTLSDFMGWNLDTRETGLLKKTNSMGNADKDESQKSSIVKPTTTGITPKKFSYLEKIESGLRSPTARH